MKRTLVTLGLLVTAVGLLLAAGAPGPPRLVNVVTSDGATQAPVGYGSGDLSVPVQGIAGGVPVPIAFQSTAGDPCQNPNIAKSSVAVTGSGAGAAQLVALVSGQKIYVCHFAATFGGTSPTAQFQYGTGTNCGTGTSNLTGVLAPSPNGTELVMGYSGTLFSTAASNALCVSLGGTSPTGSGVLTYVQQ